MLDTVKINHVQHISFTQPRLTDAVSVILRELLSYEHPSNAPVFIDGVPVTERSGHGLGARSIVYYVEKLNGQYQFFMENGDFVVMIIL